MRFFGWAVVVLGLGAAACSGRGLCVPGQSLECTCDDGTTGLQACQADSTLSNCQCESPTFLDGGPSDDGGDTNGMDGGPGARDAGRPGTDAGHPDAGHPVPDAGPGFDAGGFPEAAHVNEQVPSHRGKTISNPTLVTITYSDFGNRSEMEQLGQYLVTSSWLQETGADYGVGTGQWFKVELSSSSPSQITDDTIRSQIATWVSNGTVPAGSSSDPYIYAIYFPSTTNLTVQGVPLCIFSGGGYHSNTAEQTADVPYAVISWCNNGFAELESEQSTTSHEFMEAATDPYPAEPAYALSDSTSPWSFLGGEVADLCEFDSYADVDGYSLARIWSNTQARTGGPHCLPTSGPYYGISPGVTTMQPVAAGSSTNFTVTGWSTGSVPDWYVYTYIFGVGQSPFQPNISLGTTEMNNGRTTTLTVSVPSGTPSGSQAVVVITSQANNNDYTADLLGVYVQ